MFLCFAYECTQIKWFWKFWRFLGGKVLISFRCVYVKGTTWHLPMVTHIPSTSTSPRGLVTLNRGLQQVWSRLILCLHNPLPADGNAAGPRTTLWQPLTCDFRNQKWVGKNSWPISKHKMTLNSTWGIHDSKERGEAEATYSRLWLRLSDSQLLLCSGLEDFQDHPCSVSTGFIWGERVLCALKSLPHVTCLCWWHWNFPQIEQPHSSQLERWLQGFC